MSLGQQNVYILTYLYGMCPECPQNKALNSPHTTTPSHSFVTALQVHCQLTFLQVNRPSASYTARNEFKSQVSCLIAAAMAVMQGWSLAKKMMTLLLLVGSELFARLLTRFNSQVQWMHSTSTRTVIFVPFLLK